MSGFLTHPTWASREIFGHIDGLDPRGGASLVLGSDMVILFGGADRGQSHFNDLWVYKQSDGNPAWIKQECSGDIPTCRSGHAAIHIEGYMLLYGGIDFSEEAVYNDLYILNLGTWHWKYIGEAGAEITARNSHSFATVSGGDGLRYLVVYGGASPEEGPTLMRCIIDDKLDSEEVFVTWIKMATATTTTTSSSSSLPLSDCPGKREMHSTCIHNGCVFIAGGRDDNGAILSDVWKLGPRDACSTDTTTAPTISTTTATTGSCPIEWTRVPQLELNPPRCAHGATIIPSVTTSTATATISTSAAASTSTSSSTSASASIDTTPSSCALMCLFGGFTGGTGVANDFCVAPIDAGHTDMNTNKNNWETLRLNKSMQCRFGLSLCTAPEWMLCAAGSAKTTSLVAKKSVEGSIVDRTEAIAGVVIVGGINAEEDFNDFWIIKKH
eukprot:gene6359-12859_t